MKDNPLLKIVFIVAFLLFAISWGIWKYQYRPKAPVHPVQTDVNSPAARRK